MRTIKQILDDMRILVSELDKKKTRPDEFVFVHKLREAVRDAETVFKRTKNIEET